MVKLSIIIVLYDSELVIKDCLESISKYENHKTIEVILVDNKPDSVFDPKIIEGFNFKIEYIHSKINGGFGFGNNLGVYASKGEYLLFLNPDTILLERISDVTLKAHEDENSIIGYNLVDLTGNHNNSFGVFPQYNIISPVIFTLHKINRNFIKLKFINKLIWPWGAAFSIKKQTFLSHGGFDEKIFLCNEEPDLLIRIKKRKVKFLKTKIIHLEGHTTKVSSFRIKEFLKSTKQYCRKHNHSWRFYRRLTIVRSYLKYKLFSNEQAKDIYHILIKGEI